MTGILHKNTTGWVIRRYDGKHPAFEEIPLDPYAEARESLIQGKEVEFYLNTFWKTGMEQSMHIASIISKKTNND